VYASDDDTDAAAAAAVDVVVVVDDDGVEYNWLFRIPIDLMLKFDTGRILNSNTDVVLVVVLVVAVVFVENARTADDEDDNRSTNPLLEATTARYDTITDFAKYLILE
jgi:hypothetical protein